MKIVFASLLILGTAVQLYSQNAIALRSKHYNLEKSVAIQGYDPVAYFTQQKAIKGNKELALDQEGIVYYFSTPENKAVFQKNPFLFEPQYGGWCAYAMSRGNKVEIDPLTFKIGDNKLYLFYNRFFNNTLVSWNKDEPNLKTSAGKNWRHLFH